MKYFLLILCLCSFVFCEAQSQIKHEIIVMLSPDSSWENVENRLNSNEFKADIFQKNDFINDKLIIDNWFETKAVLSESLQIRLISIAENLDENTVMEMLQKLPEIQAVQLNYLAEYRGIPNDEFYTRQWNMDIISASEAWDFTTGGLSANGDTIVVFVIDAGIDLNHEDLSENIWINYAEIPNNGIDDDNNNYIDDYYGWFFDGNNDNHVPSLHGTSVSGVIGAKGNNTTGVSGVNWHIKILPFSIQLQSLSAANIIKAYDYALAMRQRYDNSGGSDGAYIVSTNLSAGFSNAFPQGYPILCEIYNVLGSEGILNVSAVSNNSNSNVQIDGDIPTLCPSPYLITVTNTDENDERDGAYGMTAVDLAAPGSACYTTYPINNYGTFGGTSCAAPHVTGSIALLYSLDNELFSQAILNKPEETALLVKSMILDGTDKLESLQFSTLTSGRLNIGKSMRLLSNYYEGWNETFDLITVQPNPVNDLLTVTYQTPEINNFDILLYNSIGQLITISKKDISEIGFKSFQMNLSNVEAGVYFLMLKNNQDTVIKKIVVY